MSNPFRLIAQGVDVSGINAELDTHPELWDQNRYRTQAEDSPHHGASDIWCRWRHWDDLTTPEDHREPHWAVNWPAWGILPSLHPIVRNLSHVVDATTRGAILITRTSPDAQIKPHVDIGWSAQHFDTKLYLVLRSNPLCLNMCDGHVENFRAGDVWSYPNSVLHSVRNEGATDHVNAIICFRTV